jgi:hypothetical protein
MGMRIAVLRSVSSRYKEAYLPSKQGAIARLYVSEVAPAGIGREVLVLVGPGLLAEDARCPPTSLWWALETPVTLARRGLGRRPSGGRGGCCSRSGRRSCTAAAITGVLVNASRFDGTESQKRERSC